MSDPVTTYPYKPKKSTYLIALLLCLGLTFYLGYEALHNEKGLILAHMFELTRDQANIFYSVLALALFIASCAMLAVLGRSTEKREIIIGEKTLQAPAHILASRNTVVPYKNVIHLKIQHMAGTDFLEIKHKDGRIRIPSSVCADKQTLYEIAERIEYECGLRV